MRYINLRLLTYLLTYLLGDPPPRWIQDPSVVRDNDGRPTRGTPGGALLLCV